MKTAVVIQARMGSSRLPGKVLLDLAGKPVLQHVVERCAQIAGIDSLVCAVADENDNGPLIDGARKWGAQVFIGPERDVLARYVGAARMANAAVVVRVTSDCPLIDPIVCSRVIKLRADSDADYSSNIAPRSYPKGLDCEVFTTALLDRVGGLATDAFDREHVTQWMLRMPDLCRVNLLSGDFSLAAQRWTLDYPEDLEFLRKVCVLLPPRIARIEDVLTVLASHPELTSINAGLSDERFKQTTPVKRNHG